MQRFDPSSTVAYHSSLCQLNGKARKEVNGQGELLGEGIAVKQSYSKNFANKKIPPFAGRGEFSRLSALAV